MVISSKHELFVFFGTVLGGMILGMIFDIFKVIKPSDKSNVIVTGICDMLLWCVITIAVFAIIFITNNAAVRWYEFAGMILGAVIYFMSLSRVFLAMLTAFLRLAKKLFNIIMKILLFPFMLIFRTLKPVAKFFKRRFSFVKRLYKKVKFSLQKSVKRLKHSVNKI